MGTEAKAFIIILILFILLNLWLFYKKNSQYGRNRIILRKMLYTIYLLAVFTGVLLDKIVFSDWKNLLISTAVIVFIDLGVLLTPNIIKIFSAEFEKQEETENLVMEHEKYGRMIHQRVEHMSFLVQTAGQYFYELDSKFDISTFNREKELKKYLQNYTKEFGLTVQLWEILMPQENLSTENTYDLFLNARVDNTLTRIERCNAINFGVEKPSYASLISESAMVPVKEEDILLVPLFSNMFNGIVLLKGVTGNTLEIDGFHIINLSLLFYTYSLNLGIIDSNISSEGGTEYEQVNI